VIRNGHFARVKPSIWDQWLVPNLLETVVPCRGVDQTVVWAGDSGDTAEQAAQRLLQLVVPISGPSTSVVQHAMQRDILASMRAFQDFIVSTGPQTSSSTDIPFSFSARLVSSRGSVGAKCPVWHMDHVSYRWIQALSGPGCTWVANPETAVHWDKFSVAPHPRRSIDTSSMNNENRNNVATEELSLSNELRNRQLVDANRVVIHQAHQGEGIILRGSKSCTDNGSYPAVHKSPTIRLPWQGRVLLVLNVDDSSN
jgi:Protein of unknown function (DUF1826)